MITEKDYVKKVSLAHRKKYAQFFTPELISDFMASWILDGLNESASILEPAFGLGVFSRSLYKIKPRIKVIGYDIDATIYGYAKENLINESHDITLCNDNYLTASWSDKFDGIICNPPYLKFHDYDNSTLVPIVNNKLHTHLNGFTNIYTLFLLKSIYQLNEGGRMAYIIPSEFLNADYGVEVKRALLQSRVLRHVIIVDFTKCAFDDALTTACILLCRKDENSSHVNFSKVDDVARLKTSLGEYTAYDVDKLDPEVKWKQYYENTCSSKYNNLVPFSTFAKVSRGIATGDNGYFTFKASKIDKCNIPYDSFRHCICHSADVKNLVFTENDFDMASSQDKTVYLFDGCVGGNEPHVKNYIDFGRMSGTDKKYLTASRTPWYALENRSPSPIWVSVFNRNGLRFVRNKAGVYNLTTFHCVYNISDIDTEILFAYLITDLAKEIFLDNSRQYGNGLVKFEPNDLNKGNVLDLRLLTDEEKAFVRRASDLLQHHCRISNYIQSTLDEFFRERYTIGQTNLLHYIDRLDRVDVESSVEQEIRVKPIRIKQLNLFDLFDKYADSPILENCLLQEELDVYGKQIKERWLIDPSRDCLVSFVKEDNFEQYINQSAKIYYTGKKFPSTIALNKLYYFMPYLKGKGIRDLYYIKTARIGIRKEGQPHEDKNDFRLVFEIQFVKQLFDDYKQIELQIWRTFTDTTLASVLDL